MKTQSTLHAYMLKYNLYSDKKQTYTHYMPSKVYLTALSGNSENYWKTPSCWNGWNQTQNTSN